PVTRAATGTRDEHVDELFARWTGPGRPGAAVLVVERGAIALRRFYGEASLEHAVPIDGGTVFRIGSIILTDRTRNLVFRRV
ncbi:MAG: serine hydrolase, partial [Candidatus Rokuibacteriota bacterium]